LIGEMMAGEAVLVGDVVKNCVVLISWDTLISCESIAYFFCR
jgi:hypothetical protein